MVCRDCKLHNHQQHLQSLTCPVCDLSIFTIWEEMTHYEAMEQMKS
jgi:hypothetical protein